MTLPRRSSIGSESAAAALAASFSIDESSVNSDIFSPINISEAPVLNFGVGAAAPTTNRALTQILSLIIIATATDATEMEAALEYWAQKFDELDIVDTFIAQTHKEIEHHKELRHHVPEFIISLTKSLGQALVVTDYAVPEDKIREIFTYAVEKGIEFEEFQNSSKDILGYAFFAHAGDSHIHLSLIPQTDHEAAYANSMMVAIMRKIVNMGGTIAAEHGLGKKAFEGKPALFIQYGAQGLEQVNAMKVALDPTKLLNPKNLVP